jgi:hypothetical protein
MRVGLLRTITSRTDRASVFRVAFALREKVFHTGILFSLVVLAKSCGRPESKRLLYSLGVSAGYFANFGLGLAVLRNSSGPWSVIPRY